MKKLRNRLKEIRHEMMIDTQTEMAQLLGITREQYNRYERQHIQPTLAIALQISQRLNKPIEEMFYLAD